MRKALVFFILVALCGTVYFRALSLKNPKKGKKKRRSKGGAVPVEVVQVRRGLIEDNIELTAEVEAWRETKVTPRIGGFLNEVLVREGDVVSANKTRIATIDDAELILEEQRSWAALRVSEATFKEKLAAHTESLRKLERERALYKDKVTSQENLDAVIFREKSAAAALQLAQAQVDRAKAELSLARLRRRHSRVLAPIDGVIAERYLDGGVQVSMSTTLVQIVDLDRVRVIGEVTEADYWRLLPKMKVGKVVARVKVAKSNKVANGLVRAISPVFSPNTRTATVEIELDNQDHEFLPGMFARVVLLLTKEESAILLPVEAICERKDKRGVFVVKENKVTFVSPKMGITTRKNIQVLDGLSEGDLLVTLGNHLLADNSRVNVVTPEFAKAK